MIKQPNEVAVVLRNVETERLVNVMGQKKKREQDKADKARRKTEE